MIAGDKVRVQTFVDVAIADAFAVFTEEIELWWRSGPAYRVGGALRMEPRLGGRVFEGEREIGVITAWDPPQRLAMTWRGVNFASDESTTVEVWFESRADGTRVTLEHRGFAALRPDHPVRHGKDVAAFLGDLGLWWGGLLTSLRHVVQSRP